MLVITDERCTKYASPGHPERPSRIFGSLRRLREQQDVDVEWEAPLDADPAWIERAHTPRHIAAVRHPEFFDGDTPAYPDIHEHTCRSVGGAVRAWRAAREGKAAFSLLRPPGHHATQDEAMGFCYFNGIAIAVLEARASGSRRVAVLDFDVHHGNGTEAILQDQDGVAFHSIHQHPCYPGTGTRDVGSNCFNYPVAPQTPREDYRQVIARALERIEAFRPDVIAVSAGFDAYAGDPLAQETLLAEDFAWIGRELRGLKIPVFSVLEGGYSDDLPDLILAYMKGLDGKL